MSAFVVYNKSYQFQTVKHSIFQADLFQNKFRKQAIRYQNLQYFKLLIHFSNTCSLHSIQHK